MNRPTRVSLAAAAAAVALISLSACNCCDNKEGGDETPVAMADVPSAVRATLERESKGGTVKEVEKETKNGKTVYSADIVVNGKAWDITVAEDGSVISKEEEKPGK